MREIGEEAFKDCKNLVHFPFYVTTIERASFENCSSLTYVTLPITQEIKSSAFKKCLSLIELPSFENCLKMQSIVFPPNIKQVPSNLFIGCSSLQKVHMTESVSVIDEYAFKDSPSIDYVYLSSDKVPQVSENSFCSSVYQSARLFVPVNSLQFYKEDAVWGKFENIRTSGIATNYRVEMLLSEGGTVGIRQNEDDWEYYYYGYIERTESSRIEFHIRPKQDYIIESVVLNDKDITNTLDENNEFVIPYLMENTYLSVKFKKDDPTANEKIEVYKYVYRSAPGRLCLSGFEIGDSVYIFDAGGRLVTSKKISNNIEEVDLSTKGLYLIRSGKDLFKVIL